MGFPRALEGIARVDTPIVLGIIIFEAGGVLGSNIPEWISRVLRRLRHRLEHTRKKFDLCPSPHLYILSNSCKGFVRLPPHGGRFNKLMRMGRSR